MGSDSGSGSLSGSTGVDPALHRLQMGTLNEEEIEFLRYNKELRDSMLAVEDLNFGEESDSFLCQAIQIYIFDHKIFAEAEMIFVLPAVTGDQPFPHIRPYPLSISGELPYTRQVALLRDVTVAHFVDGETIFSEGEPSDALYFVVGPSDATVMVDEHVKVASDTEMEQEERFLISVSAGRYFGEQGLLYR